MLLLLGQSAAQPTNARVIRSTKKLFRYGDLVISRLRSYLKEIAIVRCSPSDLCVGSSEFVVLRPQSGECSVSLLMVYLRSPLVQTVLAWSQDGSNHPRFDEHDLLAIPLPDRVADIQPEIDRLIDESVKSRQATKAVFAKAISEVEKFVWG